jgi:hypothetical protein
LKFIWSYNPRITQIIRRPYLHNRHFIRHRFNLITSSIRDNRIIEVPLLLLITYYKCILIFKCDSIYVFKKFNFFIKN